MVLSVRVLGSTRLAAYFVVGRVGYAARSAQHGLSHSGNHRLVVAALDAGVVLPGVERVERHSLHLLHDMRNDVPTSVCDGCAEVGNLQGGEVDFALSNADADDGQAAPVAAIGLVVIGGVGNHAALLAWQVDAELVAEAHAHHVVLPSRHGLLHRLVLLSVAEHVVEPPAEVAVARGGDGRDERQGRAVAVAAHLKPSEVEAVAAGVGRLRRDDAFLEEGECLACLEGRTGRVLTHNGPIEKRFVRVGSQHPLALSSLSAYHDAGVVGRTRHHAEHLARAWLDGNDASQFALHQPFAQSLQVDVDAHRQVASRNGCLVELPVLVASLDATSGIPEQNLHAFLSPQGRLVGTLNAELADVVAATVVMVGLDVLRTYLADVAKQVGGIRVAVLSDASLLYVETGEAEELLLEAAELFRRELAHKDLLRVGAVARVALPVLYLIHSALVPFAGDAEAFAKVERIYSLLLPHDDHHVVGRLVIDKQLAVAVGDGTAGGVLYALEESIRVGTCLEVLAEQLQREEPYQIDKDNGYGSTADDVFALLKLVIGLRSFHRAKLFYNFTILSNIYYLIIYHLPFDSWLTLWPPIFS